MHIYQEQKFNIPALAGISPEQLEIHLGLYAGYVKHVNLLREKIHDLQKTDTEKYAYAIAELRRRFSFEFNGMRMHEYYFEQFESGSTPLPSTSFGTDATSSSVKKSVSEKYGSWEKFIEHFKEVGMSRGIGWTVLYFDPKGNSSTGEPHTLWVGDHELGVLAGLPIVVALDMWEHAYMIDYKPAEKSKYIDAFLASINWKIAESRFAAA